MRSSLALDCLRSSRSCWSSIDASPFVWSVLQFLRFANTSPRNTPIIQSRGCDWLPRRHRARLSVSSMVVLAHHATSSLRLLTTRKTSLNWITVENTLPRTGGDGPGPTTWFLRKAAASSLEHRLVCRFVRSVVAFWFATPRTPPLWQRVFFLVNLLQMRRFLASERSGVVKTFR